MLELRLLHHYITHLSQPFHGSRSTDIQGTWSFEVPNLAIQHENLLYTIFAASALHLLKSDPHNPELRAARDSYWSMALREQHKAVSQLSGENADALCFTSLMILIDTFATLQERGLEPYSPPIEWMQMGRGAGAVFKTALENLEDDKTAKIKVLINAPAGNSNSSKEDIHSEQNRKSFLGLLNHHPQLSQGPIEIWDMDTREAYEDTLSVIGSIDRAINNQEAVWGVCRRLITFVFFISRRFVEFVEQGRPRALVILAHYFALASQYKFVWWMGNSAEREIWAIHRVLPPEWQDYIHWPLSVVGAQQQSGIPSAQSTYTYSS